MEKLRVSPDGRRLETLSGEPFFYLADTAWTLPQRIKWDDVRYYMSARRAQGFTAVQLVALDPERDVGMRNPAGHAALIDDDLDQPNERYFEYLDYVLDVAEEFGLYVLLLPVWGQLVVGENWGGARFAKTVTEQNAYRYGRWIGERYRERPNILWCLGGDRHPIHRGIDYRDVWRRMAEGLAKGVTGEDCRWSERSPAWSDIVITYHTCYEMETGEYSTMSYWNDDEAWLSFIVLQSGHGASTRSFEAVRREYERERTLPVIDIEPAYERMPMNWPQLFPLHGDWIVRERAYWALLAGACGHTYGHASVWCSISEKERNELLDATWYEALAHPGASQMSIVRKLVTALPFERWLPDQGLIAHLCGENCLNEHRQAARDRDGEFLIVYLSSGGSESVDLSALGSAEHLAVWLDPRTGELTEATSSSRLQSGSARLFTAPSDGAEEDWVLIVTSSPRHVDALQAPAEWGTREQTEAMSMIWAE